ncbi:MAG: hypothetical protein M1831_006069 [Alyxoria varia]|nr:MAG: hypothetical protein M1831_006069 [Alyxoria varia]
MTTTESYNFYTSTSTAVPTSCAQIKDFHNVYIQPKPDADIAGIGVIVSFLASAGLVLLASIFCYRFGLIPNVLLNDADRFCYHGRSTRSQIWQDAVHRGILVVSDQQIVTGIAIMVAGFAQWKTITVYHWEIVLYLAWMSSNTHLTTLTVLRPYLQKRNTLKTWRVTGMAILLILLLVGLSLTVSDFWNQASSEGYFVVTATRKSDWNSAGVMARCYWQDDFIHGINIDAPFSYAIIIFAYIWKVWSLWDSQFTTRRWYRDWLFDSLGKRIVNQARKIDPDQFDHCMRNPRVLGYRILMALYLGFFAIYDFCESFLASLWAILLLYLWGALVLFAARNSVPPAVRDDENYWNFGQVLPMMLLMLPMVAVFEHFFRDRELEGGRDVKDLKDNIDQRETETFIPSVTPEEAGDDFASPAVAGGTTLSTYLRESTADIPDQMIISREILYKSRFFKCLHYLINLMLFLGGGTVISMQGYAAHHAGSGIRGFLWAPVAAEIVLAMLIWFIWMTIGMFTSKLFR